MANDPYAKRLPWFVFAGSRGGVNRFRLIQTIQKPHSMQTNSQRRWV
ncbi:MAG: hypothetical protein ACKO7Y_06745 [Candidatus Nitrosotenuis sp.]